MPGWTWAPVPSSSSLGIDPTNTTLTISGEIGGMPSAAPLSAPSMRSDAASIPWGWIAVGLLVVAFVRGER